MKSLVTKESYFTGPIFGGSQPRYVITCETVEVPGMPFFWSGSEWNSSGLSKIYERRLEAERELERAVVGTRGRIWKFEIVALINLS